MYPGLSKYALFFGFYFEHPLVLPFLVLDVVFTVREFHTPFCNGRGMSRGDASPSRNQVVSQFVLICVLLLIPNSPKLALLPNFSILSLNDKHLWWRIIFRNVRLLHGAPPHTLSKFYDVSVGFNTFTIIRTLNFFNRGRRRVANTRLRIICLVAQIQMITKAAFGMKTTSG